MARQHQARVPTRDELRRVLSVCDGMTHGRRNRLIMELSFFAGLRSKELAGLTVGDVRGLNPLFYFNINPYGRQVLNMQERLLI